MNNKLQIAQCLYDLAKNSRSEFIEVAKDSEIVKIAKKMNIVVPSPDIAILKTIYAKMDEANKNNIVLPNKAAIKGLPTIIGKQANWSHKGKNYLCGWILDAKVEDDFIVTYIAIYKSLFKEEFKTMKKMVKENKMAVSFEIWSIIPESEESSLHDLGNGTYSIDPIIYHGVGILIEGETPACKEAYADKLLATKDSRLIREAEKIANESMNENLIFASMAIEKSELTGGVEVEDLKKEEVKEVKEVATEDVKTEVATEKITEEKPKEAVEETEIKEEKSVEAVTDETKTVETPVETKVEENQEVKTEVTVKEPKAEVVAEETPKAAETKTEETKVDETQKTEEAEGLEEIVPKIVVKVTSIYSDIYVDTYIDGTASGTSENKSYTKTITEYKDGTEDVVESEGEYVKKYTFAELEEKVNTAKAEKDAEIATLKAEQEKAIKEKDEKIEAQTKELGTKNQEIAKLTPKVETATAVIEEAEMTVGSVEPKVIISEEKIRASKIDEIIAMKHKR